MVSQQILTSLAIPVRRFDRPPLVVVFGLPYSGQTEIARYLAQEYKLVFMSTDWLRIRFGFSSGPQTREAMYQIAENLLSQGIGIVWDGIHLGKADRDEMRNFAKKTQAKIVLIHTTAPRELIDTRLQERCSDLQKAKSEGKYPVTKEHFAVVATYLEKPLSSEEVITIPTLAENPAENIKPFKAQFDSLVQV